MNARVVTFLIAIWAATDARAQGYAGLGEPAEGFALPDPAYRIEVQKDLGPHPDFKVEWWYLTANLTDQTGADIGAQWTLFRTALSPKKGEGWGNPDVWMAHAAVTDDTMHRFAERFARGGTGQAGVVPHPFEAWLDDWSFVLDAGEFRVRANSGDFAYDLTLVQSGPMVLHGNGGYSVKSDLGQASHYFSLPHLSVSGEVRLGGETRKVTGHAWFDREWSSQALSPDQSGWDWAALTLDDSSRLLVARVRGETDFYFGTFIQADGTVVALDARDLQMEPQSQGKPSVEWRIRVQRFDLDIAVQALNPNAWTGNLFRYWEGPVMVSGSHSGSGYLEMTGYR